MPELPPNAAPVPATPIGDMTDWTLHIQCSRCRRHVVVPLNGLAERLGERIRVAEIVRRLRCDGFRGAERCRGEPKRVILVRVATYGKTTRKLSEIVVVDTTKRP